MILFTIPDSWLLPISKTIVQSDMKTSTLEVKADWESGKWSKFI